MTIARAMRAFSATSSNSTRPAPISASSSTKTSDQTAGAPRGVSRGRARKTARTSATTARSARPLVTRWANSMASRTDGARGITSPSQSGQWLPQPAPEPETRTRRPRG